jgi:hypothetical protein
VPIHEDVASRFPLLDGIGSFEQQLIADVVTPSPVPVEI